MSDGAEADLDTVARRVEASIRKNRAVLNELEREVPANSVVGRLARSVL